MGSLRSPARNPRPTDPRRRCVSAPEAAAAVANAFRRRHCPEIRHEGQEPISRLRCARLISEVAQRGARQAPAKRCATIEPDMRPLQQLVMSSFVVCSLAASLDAASQHDAPAGRLYRIVDGKVDARTYNGFRRYHAGCNHCHGPDGIGSTFGPSLVDRLPDLEAFRRIVRDGQGTGPSVMKGFAGDPNVAPYVDDIYAYLQARADGALDRGRPIRLQQ